MPPIETVSMQLQIRRLSRNSLVRHLSPDATTWGGGGVNGGDCTQLETFSLKNFVFALPLSAFFLVAAIIMGGPTTSNMCKAPYLYFSFCLGFLECRKMYIFSCFDQHL